MQNSTVIECHNAVCSDIPVFFSNHPLNDVLQELATITTEEHGGDYSANFALRAIISYRNLPELKKFIATRTEELKQELAENGYSAYGMYQNFLKTTMISTAEEAGSTATEFMTLLGNYITEVFDTDYITQFGLADTLVKYTGPIPTSAVAFLEPLCKLDHSVVAKFVSGPSLRLNPFDPKDEAAFKAREEVVLSFKDPELRQEGKSYVLGSKIEFAVKYNLFNNASPLTEAYELLKKTYENKNKLLVTSVEDASNVLKLFPSAFCRNPDISLEAHKKLADEGIISKEVYSYMLSSLSCYNIEKSAAAVVANPGDFDLDFVAMGAGKNAPALVNAIEAALTANDNIETSSATNNTSQTDDILVNVVSFFESIIA